MLFMILFDLGFFFISTIIKMLLICVWKFSEAERFTKFTKFTKFPDWLYMCVVCEGKKENMQN